MKNLASNRQKKNLALGSEILLKLAAKSYLVCQHWLTPYIIDTLKNYSDGYGA